MTTEPRRKAAAAKSLAAFRIRSPRPPNPWRLSESGPSPASGSAARAGGKTGPWFPPGGAAGAPSGLFDRQSPSATRFGARRWLPPHPPGSQTRRRLLKAGRTAGRCRLFWDLASAAPAKSRRLTLARTGTSFPPISMVQTPLLPSFPGCQPPRTPKPPRRLLHGPWAPRGWVASLASKTQVWSYRQNPFFRFVALSAWPGGCGPPDGGGAFPLGHGHFMAIAYTTT